MGRGTQARRTAAGGRASNRVTKKGVAIAAAPTIMNHMKLTEHFSFEELIHSDTAKQRGIYNVPDAEQAACIALLAANVLEPARQEYGHPIEVTSGYRSERLNKVVGGKPSSQHMRGQAADLQADNLERLYDIIQAQGNYDQLLLESNGKSKWIHVSYNPDGNRGTSNKNYKA